MARALSGPQNATDNDQTGDTIMVLTRKAGGTARAFYAFSQGPVARAIFKRYGFLLPGEPAP